jgi:major membrane immunogen (membrane-anchored lipoprotein)
MKINLLDKVEITLKDGKKVITHPLNVEVYKKKGMLASEDVKKVKEAKK